MRGNIIGFDADTNTGAISGHDGNRYDFATQDWHGRNRPRHGDIVDFNVQGPRAYAIYPTEPEYVPPGFLAFYFSPSGRISRSQYWLRFVLPYAVIAYGLRFAIFSSVVHSATRAAFAGAEAGFLLIAFWPSIAILVKRIHDRDKSGWLCLVLYLPTLLFVILLIVWLAGSAVAVLSGAAIAALPTIGAVGIIVILLAIVSAGIGLWFFIEFGCLRGTIGANRFGPDPVR